MKSMNDYKVGKEGDCEGTRQTHDTLANLTHTHRVLTPPHLILGHRSQVVRDGGVQVTVNTWPKVASEGHRLPYVDEYVPKALLQDAGGFQ